MKIFEYILKEAKIRRPPLLDLEFEHCFNMVANKPLTSTEFNKIIKEYAPDWKRGSKSLYLLAIRMHLLIHGDLPSGLNMSATWYDQKTTRLFSFLKSKGIDGLENLQHAASEKGIELSFLNPKEDYTSEILEGIRKMTPVITTQVENLSKNPKFSWLTSEAIVNKMKDSLAIMIQKLENKKTLKDVLVSEFKQAFSLLIKEHDTKIQNQNLAKKAKEKEKEIQMRKTGHWKNDDAD